MEQTNTPVIKKETKNKISVDFEGKLTAKERFLKKIKASNTWIRIIINIFRFILMLGVSYVILYPFFARIAASFMTYEDVIASDVALIPKHFTLDTYKYLIVENHYFSAFLHTLEISLLCAVIQTFVSCLVGYGLAKFKFKLNGLIMIMVIVTMIIPHSVLQLSMKYHFAYFDFFKVLAVKDAAGNSMPGLINLLSFGSIDHLSLSSSFWPFVVLSVGGLAFKNGLYIYMMRQFFRGVPDELEESAYVDGANTFRTFFQIILPLAVPMMITVFLFAFSWQWTDEFYTGMFYRKSSETFVLMKDFYTKVPETLNLMLKRPGFEYYKKAIANTAGLMIIMPLVILYLFCQRYLVAGIERSGLVG